jgi:hypothetical protein
MRRCIRIASPGQQAAENSCRLESPHIRGRGPLEDLGGHLFRLRPATLVQQGPCPPREQVVLHGLQFVVDAVGKALPEPASGKVVAPQLDADLLALEEGSGGVLVELALLCQTATAVDQRPAALVTGPYTRDPDVDESRGQRFIIAHILGKADGPFAPGDRLCVLKAQHVEVRLVAVGHGELASGRQRL